MNIELRTISFSTVPYQEMKNDQHFFKPSSVAVQILKNVPVSSSADTKFKEAAVVPSCEITIDLVYGTYTGCHQEGQPHGFGLMIFKKNETEKRKAFHGNYQNGKMHGWGVLTWVDGKTYEGHFKEDQITGKGTMKWISGAEYIGEFVDGEFNGQGTYKFANGDSYVGAFLKGQMTGQGKKNYTNGMTYSGEWENGKWIMGTESYKPIEENSKVKDEFH